MYNALLLLVLVLVVLVLVLVLVLVVLVVLILTFAHRYRLGHKPGPYHTCARTAYFLSLLLKYIYVRTSDKRP